MAKIVFERSKCAGCGMCANLCPEFWEMSDDGKSTLKGAKKVKGEVYELEVGDAGCNKEVESRCPANCVHVKE